MMHFVQSRPRPDGFEVMAEAYAMASGLCDVERAAEAYAHDSHAALEMLRQACKDSERTTLKFVDSLGAIYQALSAPDSDIPVSLAPFVEILEEMRESEAKQDRDMTEHPQFREIMTPLRRATAKARSIVSDIVLLIRQRTPGEQTAIPGKSDPEALRALASVSTRLLEERFG